MEKGEILNEHYLKELNIQQFVYHLLTYSGGLIFSTATRAV